MEYFELEPDKEHCDELPYTTVTFGNPFTPTEVGSLRDPYEDPGAFCTGEQDFKFSRSEAGNVQVEAGFKTQRGVISYLFNLVDTSRWITSYAY